MVVSTMRSPSLLADIVRQLIHDPVDGVRIAGLVAESLEAQRLRRGDARLLRLQHTGLDHAAEHHVDPGARLLDDSRVGA